jgi:hypothetical protein
MIMIYPHDSLNVSHAVGSGIGHLGIVLASGTDLERKIRQTSNGFERWEAEAQKYHGLIMFIFS